MGISRSRLNHSKSRQTQNLFICDKKTYPVPDQKLDYKSVYLSDLRESFHTIVKHKPFINVYDNVLSIVKNNFVLIKSTHKTLRGEKIEIYNISLSERESQENTILFFCTARIFDDPDYYRAKLIINKEQYELFFGFDIR